MSQRSLSLSLRLLALAVLGGATGCPQDHADSGGGHGHAHGGAGGHAGPGGGAGGHGHGGGGGEKTEAYTAFSARHEVFVEHPFLLAGEPAELITHVTDTVTGEPRTEGSVTLVLELDGQTLEHVVPRVARTGIYLPEITFPEAGEWEVALRVPMEDGHDVVPLPDHTVYASQEAIDAAPAPEPVDGISFLKEQQWTLDFGTAPVERRTLVERLQLPGRLRAPPSGRAIVSAPVGGRLLPPEGGELPALGQRVEAGEVLARVRPRLAGSDHLTFLSSRQQLTALRLEFDAKAAEAQAEAERAEAALGRAEQQLERVRRLAERQAKAPREVEQAEYEHARARAELRAAEVRRRLYTDVEERLTELPADLGQGFPAVALTAPIAGTLVGAAGARGERVAAGAAVFTVLDRSRLHLEVGVPETRVERLAERPGVVFTTPGRRGTYREVLGEGGGRLVLAAEEVDPATRAARLVYALPNRGDLAAGLAVEAFVETETATEALAIPASALVEEDGRYVAYVMLGGETFEKRDLELGVEDAGRVEVTSGLAGGERVVHRGAYAVKLASSATAAPAHGHAH